MGEGAKPLKDIDDNKPTFKSVTDFKFEQKATVPISFQCIRADLSACVHLCPPLNHYVSKSITLFTTLTPFTFRFVYVINNIVTNF